MHHQDEHGSAYAAALTRAMATAMNMVFFLSGLFIKILLEYNLTGLLHDRPGPTSMAGQLNGSGQLPAMVLKLGQECLEMRQNAHKQMGAAGLDN